MLFISDVWILQQQCTLRCKPFIYNVYFFINSYWYPRLLSLPIKSQLGVAYKTVSYKKTWRNNFPLWGYYCVYTVFHCGDIVKLMLSKTGVRKKSWKGGTSWSYRGGVVSRRNIQTFCTLRSLTLHCFLLSSLVFLSHHIFEYYFLSLKLIFNPEMNNNRTKDKRRNNNNNNVDTFANYVTFMLLVSLCALWKYPHQNHLFTRDI